MSTLVSVFKSPFRIVFWLSDPKQVLLCIPGSPETRAFEISPQLYFHSFNSYEFDNGRYVVMDTIGCDEMDYSIQISKLTPDVYNNKRTRPTCQRVVLDLLTGEVKQEPLIGRSVDGFFDMNPSLSGRPHQFYFVGCSGVVNENDDAIWGPNQVEFMTFSRSEIFKLTAKFDPLFVHQCVHPNRLQTVIAVRIFLN